MNTQSRDNSEQDLIDRLHRLPLEKAPADLTDRVMARIATPPPSLIGSIWSLVSRSYSLSFRPVYAFGIAILVCGAFFLGRNTREIPIQVVQTPVPAAQIQPESIENPESAYLVGRGLLREITVKGRRSPFFSGHRVLNRETRNLPIGKVSDTGRTETRMRSSRSYLRGLEADPENIPLLINLGHSYLE